MLNGRLGDKAQQVLAGGFDELLDVCITHGVLLFFLILHYWHASHSRYSDEENLWHLRATVVTVLVLS